MDLQALLSTYGYAALVVGCFLEGETILVLAGLAAHRGYLELPWTIVAAFAGSVLGDQLYFYLGRKYGPRLLRRRPRWQGAAARVQAWLHRRRDLFILGFRFLYGLRTVSPFVIGLSDVTLLRFTVLNVAGALVWSASFASAGYAFGHGVETLLGRARKYELVLFGALAAVGFGVWLLRWRRLRRGGSTGDV